MAKQTIIFDPPELMQAALTKVNENFDELYANPKDEAVEKTASFSVDPEVRTYKIDRTSGNILATFDLTTCANKQFDFLIIDDTANTFSIDDISGAATMYGEATPYNLDANGDETISIYVDGTKFYIK